MLTIGLTGNLGTGKSTVSGMLAEFGAAIIDADKLGHEFLVAKSDAYNELIETFGTVILDSHGEIDRGKLGLIVFSSDPQRDKLNRILHPRISRLAQERINDYRGHRKKVIVLEAALLNEGGWPSMVDKVWVTIAPEHVIKERLKVSRGMTDQQVVDRLRCQMPQEEKIKHADMVIDTDCTMKELREKVTGLWQKIQP